MGEKRQDGFQTRFAESGTQKRAGKRERKARTGGPRAKYSRAGELDTPKKKKATPPGEGKQSAVVFETVPKKGSRTGQTKMLASRL